MMGDYVWTLNRDDNQKKGQTNLKFQLILLFIIVTCSSFKLRVNSTQKNTETCFTSIIVLYNL